MGGPSHSNNSPAHAHLEKTHGAHHTVQSPPGICQSMIQLYAGAGRSVGVYLVDARTHMRVGSGYVCCDIVLVDEGCCGSFGDFE